MDIDTSLSKGDREGVGQSTISQSALSTNTFNESLLDSYSDDELVAYIHESPRLITTRPEQIRLLSPNLVAKLVGYHDEEPLDEVLALQRARAAGVSAPALRRLVYAADIEYYYIVMERVHGFTLEQLWRDLGWLGTFRAAWQLRSNLRLLHSITSQTTGGLHSGCTRSERLQDQWGPIRHASPAEFVGYLNWWLTECRPTAFEPRPHLVLAPEREHVLVHQDLAPRNMILDPSGKLWLVDWGHAGFYPAYMEYFGIEARTHAMPWIAEQTWTAWWARLRWSFFRWIAAGFAYHYHRPWQAFGNVSIRTQRFRLDQTPYSNKL